MTHCGAGILRLTSLSLARQIAQSCYYANLVRESLPERWHERQRSCYQGNPRRVWADPLFHLTHGFGDLAVKHRIKTRVFVRKTGKTAFVNPRRYGGMPFYDYARYRLSVFTREEVRAIVAYLGYKRDSDPHNVHIEEVDAALNLFWLERAANAPSAESIEQHLIEEEAYLAELESDAAVRPG
jgi:hypothetical protein